MSGSDIFIDKQDYRVFLFYIYIYTHPSEEVADRFSDLPKRLKDKTLYGQMNLLAYSILPDHFHLLIKQTEKDAMPKLLKQVANGYTAYFNHKYGRRGPVFAGRYKAVEVDDASLADFVRYIHREPVEKKLVSALDECEWSSYKKYIDEESFLDCDTSLLMSKLGTLEGLIDFHTNSTSYQESLMKIKHLIIEETV